MDREKSDGHEFFVDYVVRGCNGKIVSSVLCVGDSDKASTKLERMTLDVGECFRFSASFMVVDRYLNLKFFKGESRLNEKVLEAINDGGTEEELSLVFIEELTKILQECRDDDTEESVRDL